MVEMDSSYNAIGGKLLLGVLVIVAAVPPLAGFENRYV